MEREAGKVRDEMSKPRGSGRAPLDVAPIMATALAAHRAGQLAQAVALYDKVLSAERRHAGATHLKGVALLQSGSLPEAHALLVRAGRLAPRNAAARSDLGLCLMRMGRMEEAAETLAEAVKLQPDAAEVHANRGHALSMLGRHAESLACFERALVLRPGHGELAVHQASALARLGRQAEALVVVGRVLSAAPGHPVALKVRGDIAAGTGQNEEAGTYYDQALAAAPDFADARLARAGHRLAREQAVAALEDFDHVLRAMPRHAPALSGRGAALLLADRPLEALASLQDAVATGAADDPTTQANLAVALVAIGRNAEALVAAEQALALDGTLPAAWLVKGNALAGLARLDEAVASYDRAIGLRSNLVEAHYEKAAALRRLNRGAEAIAQCDAVLALEPEHFEARWLKAFSLLPAVPWSAMEVAQSRAELSTALDELAAAVGAASSWEAVGRIKPFYLTYHEDDNRPLLMRYGELCHRLMSNWQSQSGIVASMPGPPVGRKIRLGVVSCNFSHQSVWTAITKGWVTGLDRDRFELHLFGTGDAVDEQTRIACKNADSFVHGRRGMKAWAEAVIERQLDVLIYPEIGVDPVSLRLACLRLASVQAVTWGHPATSGLPTIDAYLSGDAFEPDGAEAHYSERLIRLPGLGVRYSRLGVQPVSFEPARYGVPEDRPLLVSPGTPFKYEPEHDGVLVEIARRLGRTTIVMFDPPFYPRAFFDRLKTRLARAFADAGLDMDEYVRVLPWMKPGEFYGLMTRADAFLDTIGFSGFNTAMQAVECALPIVTREGRFLRGRLASALYREMGMSDMIAVDEAAYVDLAVRLATDPSFRDATRERMLATRAALFDDERPVRALEDWLDTVRGQDSI